MIILPNWFRYYTMKAILASKTQLLNMFLTCTTILKLPCPENSGIKLLPTLINTIETYTTPFTGKTATHSGMYSFNTKMEYT